MCPSVLCMSYKLAQSDSSSVFGARILLSWDVMIDQGFRCGQPDPPIIKCPFSLSSASFSSHWWCPGSIYHGAESGDHRIFSFLLRLFAGSQKNSLLAVWLLEVESKVEKQHSCAMCPFIGRVSSLAFFSKVTNEVFLVWHWFLNLPC